MLKLLAFLIGLTFVLIPLSSPQAALKRYQYTDSVGIAFSFFKGDDNQQMGSATAWAIDKNHLVTAGHFCQTVDELVEAGQSDGIIYIGLVDYQGKPLRRVDAIISYITDSPDVCILLSPDHHMVPLPIGQPESLQVGDELLYVGAPDGILPVIELGTLISINGWQITQGKADLILFNGRILLGHSGSPLLAKHKVIGMIIGYGKGINSFGLAVNIRDITIAFQEAMLLELQPVK